MTTAPDPRDGEAVERQARQLHAVALAQVSTPTLARLRAARAATAAAPRRAPLLAPWLAGGAVAAALALALVLHPQPPGPPADTAPATVATTAPPATPVAPAATSADPADTLQEDPGFYVWLDSVDPAALAME